VVKPWALLHLWLHPYYTWGRYYICGHSLITLEGVTTFVPTPLLHLRALSHLWSLPYYTWGRYHICDNALKCNRGVGTNVVTPSSVIREWPHLPTFVVTPLLHLRALSHLWSLPYYTWGRYHICGHSLITAFEGVITFVVSTIYQSHKLQSYFFL